MWLERDGVKVANRVDSFTVAYDAGFQLEFCDAGQIWRLHLRSAEAECLCWMLRAATDGSVHDSAGYMESYFRGEHGHKHKDKGAGASARESLVPTQAAGSEA